MPLAVCATPIGNLEDVTLRVLAELREADVVLCEDTRHTRGAARPLRHPAQGGCSATTSTTRRARTAELLPRLAAGERMALVSDAGLPGVNDPGGRLVSAALERGVPVTVLPGPSAVETALVGSRVSRATSTGSSATSRVARPSGRRCGASCADGRIRRSASSRRSGCLRRCAASRPRSPERAVAVCRELTKRFEEVVRGTRRAGRERSPAAQGRDHAGHRRVRLGRRPKTGRSPPPSRRSTSSSPPDGPAVRGGAGRLPDRALPERLSTSARCKHF